jgi:low temperature requirement protein LtrA
MYFGSGDDERGEQAMRAAGEDRRPGLALSAYFYAHMPMLLGIVFAAAAVAEEVKVAGTGHGGGGLPAALALGVGAAAFVGGTAAFRETLHIGPVRWRLWTATFAAATIPLGGLVSIEAQLAVVTAGLAVLLVLEGHARA